MDGFNILLLGLAFVSIWAGAGAIVVSVDKFSHKLKASSFAVSFFVLGILTSIPEFAVGMRAVAARDPQIFVGNLLGGSLTLFLIVIPMLAVFGGGVELLHKLNKRDLLISLVFIGCPVLFLLEGNVSVLEAVVMVGLYVVLFFLIEKHKGLIDNNNTNVLQLKAYSFVDILKLLLGIALVFLASEIIVSQTVVIADTLRLSHFVVSLLLLSVGTNLPELTLALRSIMDRKKSIAFGDYLGSAAANTLLMGVFTLLMGGVFVDDNFLVTFLFMTLGLGLFYYFSLSKLSLSPKEGKILLSIYVLFVIAELALG